MVNKALIPYIEEGYREYKEHAVRSTGKNLLHYSYSVIGLATFNYWEQNPNKASKWAQLANSGHEVVQVFWDNSYIAVFVDSKLELYP